MAGPIRGGNQHLCAWHRHRDAISTTWPTLGQNQVPVALESWVMWSRLSDHSGRSGKSASERDMETPESSALPGGNGEDLPGAGG